MSAVHYVNVELCLFACMMSVLLRSVYFTYTHVISRPVCIFTSCLGQSSSSCAAHLLQTIRQVTAACSVVFLSQLVFMVEKTHNGCCICAVDGVSSRFGGSSQQWEPASPQQYEHWQPDWPWRQCKHVSEPGIHTALLTASDLDTISHTQQMCGMWQPFPHFRHHLMA